MKKTLKIGKTQWMLIQSPEKEEIYSLAKKYDFHEMIVNDLLEMNVQSKIESSGKHFFLALSFTKYLSDKSRYAFNELDVIIGEDYIITTIGFESNTLNDLFSKISEEVEEIDGSYKSSPYYILYRIIDAFYSKSMKGLSYSGQKLLEIQDQIADFKLEKEIIDELVSEDLDKILIKNNFLSQKDVISDLAEHTRLLHDKKLTVYFNDLKVKLSRLINAVIVLTEKNDSLMGAYNTFVGIKNNKSVTRLTFVNAIFMPLTLIAGIGGMSEWSMMTGPQNWRFTYPLFILLCIIISFVTYIILSKFFMKK